MTTQPPAPQLALIALSPCPLCGVDAASVEEDVDTGDFQVVCDASTWNNRGGCGASTGYQESAEEAITAWNTRPQSRPEAVLPELPESQEFVFAADGEGYDMLTAGKCYYTADQLRAYGQQCAATRMPAELPAIPSLIAYPSSTVPTVSRTVDEWLERFMPHADYHEGLVYQAIIDFFKSYRSAATRPAEVGGAVRASDLELIVAQMREEGSRAFDYYAQRISNLCTPAPGSEVKS